MVDTRKISVGKQIRNLFMVMFSGMIAAVVVSLAFLYYMSPTGSFSVSNVLLNPDVAEQLAYSEVNPRTGKSIKYVFDRVEFHYIQEGTLAPKRINFDLNQYSEFYDLISSETSMVVVPDHIKGDFYWDKPATLTLTVKKEGEATPGEGAMSFQSVQFTRGGDYYRIQLREESQEPTWVYYYHPGIYHKILKITERSQ